MVAREIEFPILQYSNQGQTSIPYLCLGFYMRPANHALLSGVARAFPGGWAAQPEDQIEEEN